MSRRKQKKRKTGILGSRFYRVYFAVVAAALAAIVIGLVWLNGAVRDYEIAQPVHAAEQVVRLFEEGNYARIYDLDASVKALSGVDEAFYVQSLSSLAEGKAIQWREAYSEDANERRYSVTLDGGKLATFTLVPSGQTTGHGNTLWVLGTLSTNVALQGTDTAGDLLAAPYRISAPSGYTVTVDGRTLTEADVLNSGVSIFPEGFLPSGVEAPTMTEYAFSSDLESPEISAVDADGATAEIVREGDTVWKCPLKENEALREQYGKAVITLGERIAKYTVKDLSRSAVLSNVASDSPAEALLKKFSNSWAPPHRTAAVSDAAVTDFYVLSEDCFTCHVEFTFTLTTRRGNDYVYPTSYTFCVIRHRGEGKLYNLTFN